jgi:rhodanese-related sulfurtransferase
MRFIFPMLLISAVALIGFAAACQKTPAPRISLVNAKKDFDAGQAVFVDTRNDSEFAQNHIKGAVNISGTTFEAKYKELPIDKKIIVYCS